MSSAPWQEVEKVLAEVLELSESERIPRIDTLCAGHSELEAEVKSLLAAHYRSTSFLESPVQVGFRADPDFSFEGKHLGSYRLLAPLGRGGMGTVYRAERTDGRFHKQVAVKVVPAAAYSGELLHRFSSEQQILAALENANIARLLDAGVSPEGVPYLVMEYVEGVPVTEYCSTHTLSARERLKLVQTVCSAVHYAHQHLVIHRDLKPANVLVSREGLVKLLDFGVAKILYPYDTNDNTRSLWTPMTPAYASPEQARGEPLTTASDVYSLGVVLYELLTGETPYRVSGKPLSEAIRIISETDAEKPSAVLRGRRSPNDESTLALSADLDAIVAKAMRKDPQQRYASAEELSADIGRSLEGLPVAARRGTLQYRASKFVSRHRLGVGATVAAAVLLLSFAATMALQAHRIAKERDRANREAEVSKRVAEFMTNMFKVSDPNQSRGNTITAREILDKASGEINTGLAKDPNLQMRMMHVMGRSYLSLGPYARAESLLRRGIEVGRSAGEKDGREALGIWQDLAWTLWQQGRLAEAESLNRTLLGVQRHVLGPEDPDTVGTISQLAAILDAQGNQAEAVKLGREALEKQKRILGPEAFDTLATMDNLAIMLAENGQLDEAKKLEQETLEIQLRVFGPENLGTISSMINMADFERDLGRSEEAKKMFRQVLDVETRVLGPDQPETAETRYDLACLLARGGQTWDAFSLLRQAVGHGLPPRITAGIQKDPCFHSLHGDPRFAALLALAKEHSPTQKASD